MVTGNAVVNIGTQSSYGNVPVLGANITGDVFGGGNNADIRGNTYVNISAANTNGVPDGNAVNLTGNTGYEGIKIKGNIYGGGNMGSVGTFDHINDAKPTVLTQNGTGTSTVTILGDAEIGPDNMKMITASGMPDNKGHVFGASRGLSIDPQKDANIKFKTYVYDSKVTIGGTAFIKGSVYGGSENGHVLHNTHVIIKDNCQIGNGDGVNRRYTDQEWTTATSLAECASWTYDASNPKPYDPYDSVYVNQTKVPKAATDGHTYYGNVFGGGSGMLPYGPNPHITAIKEIDPNYGDGLWMLLILSTTTISAIGPVKCFSARTRVSSATSNCSMRNVFAGKSLMCAAYHFCNIGVIFVFVSPPADTSDINGARESQKICPNNFTAFCTMCVN